MPGTKGVAFRERVNARKWEQRANNVWSKLYGLTTTPNNIVALSTLSLIEGNPKGPGACNYCCPFCISHANDTNERRIEGFPTPIEKIEFYSKIFNKVAFGLPHGMATGIGETTLAEPERLKQVFALWHDMGIISELQTNGSLLTHENLTLWHNNNKGLNTVAISCVSHFDQVNANILSKGRVPYNLAKTVGEARDIGLLVRLCVTMLRGDHGEGVNSPDSLLAFLKFAKEVGAEQVTFREMGKPRMIVEDRAKKVADWIDRHYVNPSFVINVLEGVGATKEASLPWSVRYFYNGLSVVLAECLTPPIDGKVRSAVIRGNGLYDGWDRPMRIA